MAIFKKKETTIDLINKVDYIVKSYPNASSEKILAMFGVKNKSRVKIHLQTLGLLPKDKEYNEIVKDADKIMKELGLEVA